MSPFVDRPIDTSVFEMFKVGPGPSSSHTMAPMLAGNDFVRLAADLPADALARAARLEVRLFGSLSATGRGHGTGWAVLAGLLGQTPEACPVDYLDTLAHRPQAAHPLRLGPARLLVGVGDVVFDAVEHDYPFSNTMLFTLLDRHGGVLFRREYYSVGGGFLQWKGYVPPARGVPVHPFDSMNTLAARCRDTGLALPELILENERAVTGAGLAEIEERLDFVARVMDDSVRQGLAEKGLLSGPFGVERRARDMLEHARQDPVPEDRFLGSLSAYAQAGAEENAAGHKIVTAPTAGSAGLMAGVVHMLKSERKRPDREIRQGLLAAAAIGMLCRENASIAGAEVGCQGEVGVAASMGAALLAAAAGKGLEVIENAAELALEHHLGMTCDPVGGFVQVPCISRCAMGAVKAYNAYVMAAFSLGTRNPVGLDVVIRTMAATGRDMQSKYKETSQGGLALFLTHC